MLVSATAAIFLYFQAKKGIAQREALTVLRDHTGDKDWIKDEADWQKLREKLCAHHHGGDSDANIRTGLAAYVSATPKPQPQEDTQEVKTSENCPFSYNGELAGIITMPADQTPNNHIDKKESATFLDERALILRRLNRFEMIAIGIKKGAIDKEIIKLWWQSGTIREFLIHREFIAAARQKSAKVYRQFHWLVDHWASEEDRQTLLTSLGPPHQLHPDSRAALNLLAQFIRHWRTAVIVLFIGAALWFGTWLGTPKTNTPPVEPYSAIEQSSQPNK